MSQPQDPPETAGQEAVENPPQQTEAGAWTPGPRRLRQGGEAISDTYEGDDDAGDCGLAA